MKMNSSEIVKILFPLLFVIFSFTNEVESNINVTLIKIEDEYEVIDTYDFFIPEVDIICQCSCTNENEESCGQVERDCALLSNSTTTCTNYITSDTDSSVCFKFKKLCCQVYFTKTKWTKPYKALHLNYNKTFLTLQIASISPDNMFNAYNVTITDNVKNLLLSDDKVLHIPECHLLRHIPETWYFINGINGINELKFSDTMNAKDEHDMNKIGWFQYDAKNGEMSGVSESNLNKHLQVNLLHCHSNPPNYEWRLNAVFFIRIGKLYLPKQVQIQTVSDMFKDISFISIDLKENKINIGAMDGSNINAVLSSVTSYPFIFTSSIDVTILNLTFTKGNGIFEVEITSPYWTDIITFSALSPVEISTLPPKKYDSCQVCVSQNDLQLCQIPNIVKSDEKSVETTTEGLNKIDNELTTIPSISENQYSTVVTLAITLSLLLLLIPLGVVIFFMLLIKKKVKMQELRMRLIDLLKPDEETTIQYITLEQAMQENQREQEPQLIQTSSND